MRKLSPDWIITTAQGYWGSLAASELGVPWSSFHLYPQLFERSFQGAHRSWQSRFAPRLSGWLATQERDRGLRTTDRPVLDWSVHAMNTVTAHDAAIIDFAEMGVKTLGFPYLDDVFRSGINRTQAIEFAATSEVPVIVVALGSFIGLVDNEFWQLIRETAAACGYRFLLVGSSLDLDNNGRNDHVLVSPHIPLSSVLPYTKLLIHHGGIGSTYAALHFGVPALVRPYAFDQSYNCNLVTRLGTGLELPRADQDWSKAITAALESRDLSSKASSVAESLTPPDKAAAAIAHQLVSTGT
jgi:hypothetical protein